MTSAGAAPATLARSVMMAAPFLSPDEHRSLELCTAAQRELRTNAELVREDERNDALYLLVEGWGCRFRTTADGRRQIVALLMPGDLGNLASIADQPGSGVRMLTPGVVGVIRRDSVRALAATYPAIDRAIAWLAQADAAILEQWMLCLGRRSARDRLAHLLCEIAVRAGCHDGTGQIAFDMPLTQDHIADVLGLTPVHVNRTIQQLRAEGLITSSLRRIVVPDIAALRQTCDFDAGYLVTYRAGAARDDHAQYATCGG